MSNLPSYSFSALKSFNECKYLYKLAYVDKISAPKKPFAVILGDVIHKTIDKFSKEKKFDKNVLFNIYNTIYDYTFKDEYQNKKDEGYIFLENYYKYDIVDKRISYLLYSEKYISVGLEKYFLKGVIDRVYNFNNRYYILDLKTNRFMAPSVFQIYFYSFIFYKIANITSDVIFLFLATGRSETYKVDHNKYKIIENKINRFHEKISNEKEFYPNFKHCKFCFFKSVCDKNPWNYNK